MRSAISAATSKGTSPKIKLTRGSRFHATVSAKPNTKPRAGKAIEATAKDSREANVGRALRAASATVPHIANVKAAFASGLRFQHLTPRFRIALSSVLPCCDEIAAFKLTRLPRRSLATPSRRDLPASSDACRPHRKGGRTLSFVPQVSPRADYLIYGDAEAQESRCQPDPLNHLWFFPLVG